MCYPSPLHTITHPGQGCRLFLAARPAARNDRSTWLREGSDTPCLRHEKGLVENVLNQGGPHLRGTASSLNAPGVPPDSLNATVDPTMHVVVAGGIRQTRPQQVAPVAIEE